MSSFGLLAEYENPAQLYAACERVRDAGYTKWDACSPFAVHGLDKAMGLLGARSLAELGPHLLVDAPC